MKLFSFTEFLFSYLTECFIHFIFHIHFHFIFPRSPLSATVIDEFEVKCRNWKNKGRPIRYQFLYRDDSAKTQKNESESTDQSFDENRLRLLNPGTGDLPLVRSLLPLGLKKRNYSMTVIARVLNEYGQYAVEELEIQVTFFSQLIFSGFQKQSTFLRMDTVTEKEFM